MYTLHNVSHDVSMLSSIQLFLIEVVTKEVYFQFLSVPSFFLGHTHCLTCPISHPVKPQQIIPPISCYPLCPPPSPPPPPPTASISYLTPIYHLSGLHIFLPYCRLRVRRALMLFNNVPLRTRRALLLYTFYSDSPLLVLNGTSLSSVNALLALNWW